MMLEKRKMSVMIRMKITKQREKGKENKIVKQRSKHSTSCFNVA